ncbi:uncharacterized protein LACBIDRAFT_330517 [Laccaria bicolor S238N-H82]|uniref:Predicted protein n=1 Tax=Laccaria bicolor (strain S238N-H82 / ATCC MYA-4686) TaxID=486041 RepID=B0DLJ9_LACBS|nr:uncharacterized protein LACBIDRAFT_330517 [Laccaria bicolor S238N-H82]EDR04580.1 predicted protein [Laccaria bicolor S238N-H82]|eukprot:XP_001884752.1 predicted protein [Laccaria bicolor S238N-H82]
MFLGSFQCQIPVPHMADLMAPRYQSFQIEKPVSEFFTGTYPWDEKDQDADKEEAHSLDVEDEEIDLRAIGKFEITHILFHEDLPEMKEIRDGKQCQAPTKWGASALQATVSMGRGHYCTRQLTTLVRKFLDDRTFLLVNPYGDWNQSMLIDEDLSLDINLYLQEIGKDVSAKKVKGQYADGHECEDVVYYQDHTFLPQWKVLEARMENWSKENEKEHGPRPDGKTVISWFNDECIFYANDRTLRGWYHKDSPEKPYTKGEGAPLMIGKFVSAKFGWLQSPDGKQSTRIIMKPGKNCDGYMTADDIVDQANCAMDILTEWYPEYEHVSIYDNTPTHLKRPDGLLSARRMPKNIPKEGHNWVVEVTKRDNTGNPVHLPDRTTAKEKIKMGNARFADGTPQALYFPEGHPRTGVFKGMAYILEECGLVKELKLHAECKNFKCAPLAIDCCCHWVLYNQPDFTHIPTILKNTCNTRGFRLIYLPNFHCELNFIEQCWGYAKRIYRLNPPSSKEEVLEKYALAVLDSISLAQMRRFSNRSQKFMDAYVKGLNGRQAAWAARKYKGHRVLPDSLMDDLEKAKIT